MLPAAEYRWTMRRQAPLGNDPLATLTLLGAALIVSAVFLGALQSDGGAPGPIEAAIVIVPLLLVGGFAFAGAKPRIPSAPSLEPTAVEILTADFDRPTIDVDPVLKMAAADLLTAINDAERRDAEERLRQSLSRVATPRAIRPSG